MKVLIIGSKGMLGQELARKFAQTTENLLVLRNSKSEGGHSLLSEANENSHSLLSEANENSHSLLSEANENSHSLLSEANENSHSLLSELDHDLILWGSADLDITKEKDVEQKICSLAPDLIINAAAYNDVDQAETEFKTANAVNTQGPINIAKASQKVNAIFVHFSTDYVFDGTRKEGYTESDTPNPISKYGESKLGGEKARDYCEKCYIIRTSRLYGKPAISKSAKKSFVDTMLKLAQERDSLDIVDEELSCPTYAPDLAQFTRDLVESGSKFGIYHGVNQGSCTWFEFAKEIFAISGKDVTINPVKGDKFPRPAKRPQFSVLLNTKRPQLRSWKEALKEYLNTKFETRNAN